MATRSSHQELTYHTIRNKKIQSFHHVKKIELLYGMSHSLKFVTHSSRICYHKNQKQLTPEVSSLFLEDYLVSSLHYTCDN